MHLHILRPFPAVVVLLAGFQALHAAVPSPDRLRVNLLDDRLSVHGLPWFHEDKPVLRRLPARRQNTFRPPVWELAQHPSGGRIRFQTDSLTVGLVAENPRFSNMHHMASVGENGFDLYVDREYLGSAWPDATGKIAKEWRIGPEPRLREITLYLPLYKAVTVTELSLDANARLERPAPYAIERPVVYYGSSITQGGCASNPGGTCPAILERRLNADFVNLGFSGNGLGDPAVAEAFTAIRSASTSTPPASNLPSAKPSSGRLRPQPTIGGTAPFTHGGLPVLNPSQTLGPVDGVHCHSLALRFNAAARCPSGAGR